MSDRWRVGRSLGRTLYIRTGGDDLKADTFVGVVDSRELAEAIVSAMNGRADLRDKVEALPPVASDGRGDIAIWRADVLALIDGDGDD
jgi:hypothetical protein